MIQFTTMLKPICTHRDFCRKEWCKDSNLTLHRMGYIITSRPIAVDPSATSIWKHRLSERTNWNGNSYEFPFLQGWTGVGDKIAQQNANEHRQENP